MDINGDDNINEAESVPGQQGNIYIKEEPADTDVVAEQNFEYIIFGQPDDEHKGFVFCNVKEEVDENISSDDKIDPASYCKTEMERTDTNVIYLKVEKQNSDEEPTMESKSKTETSNIEVLANVFKDKIPSGISTFEDREDKNQTKHTAKKNVKLLHKKRKVYKNHECSYCHEKYISPSHLKIHVTAVHEKIKYECAECHKTLSYYQCLKQHVESAHIRNRKYECDMCHKTFLRRSGVKSHMYSVHEGIIIKNYTCRFCDKTFSHREDLTTHIDREHKRVKKHECYECHKMFYKPAYLSEHISRVHKGIKYECKECNRKYAHKRSYRKHIKDVHEAKYFSDVTQ